MTRSAIRPLLSLGCLLAAFAAAAASPGSRTEDAALFGFSTGAATAQQDLERRFDAQLDPAELRDWLKQMASQPNQVGSPHDKANAEFILAKFREWGWDAHIETFSVLYPTPKKVALELLGPNPYTAALHEPAVAGDATSDLAGVLPPYNIYGADGDVSAPLVYANYGMPDDYKELARRGVDVRGKIVITRYGGGWRGLKPKLAQEHGAIGCLIYSDPHDDGYAMGDAYPQGGWRPAQGVQRGSVADMQLYPGDPLTPGIGSTPGAKRLALKDAKTILKIPVLPISYADATPLLQALRGPMAPANWRGALPLTYRVGPSASKVHLTVLSDWGQKPVYDVIAMLKGATAPDQWVVRGNHHDGWTFGAWDPLSGNVTLMAEAKAIGGLVKQGWRPQRTLVYASWDGEEPGLLGSTEWAEAHAAELQQKAVLYLNSDTNARGFLGAGGSHSLQHLVNQVADGVTDPETHVSVRERLRAHMLVEGSSKDAKPETKAIAKLAAEGGDVPIQALGSGSDYSAFLEHLGIASLNLGFGGEDDDAGIYHSRYDSFDHYARFGDPDFGYGVALAKVAGHIMLRTADAGVLPMRFGDFSDTLDRYVGELHTLVDDTRKATEQQHKLLDSHAFALDADPTRPVAPPARDSDMPAIDLAPLDQAAKRLRQSAQAYQAAYARHAAGPDLPAARQQQLNQLIGRMEQNLTDPAGLPGRNWFKHFIYAPGMLTGYGVKTVPGVREAIEARRWDEASHYAALTAKVLDRYRAQLDRLTVLLDKRS
ncbi:transferrin receptor-like dimerization domain-containing protein [Rhodanobacter thiooxydans]|uniref:transferrin receptor-like dimerization domain-containing protein n=1 Tax=Rhodanobacter thiooxydans TaxID=416169 RepID=UPI000260E2F9|nr:transferrin receptor-like dimerization domain-containing protein [Rhodanobacter thiooxydans]EIL97410.1 glutamate carboxypeptidase II [Rhodanobacter thiooxydans LCS2]MCW0201858.1 M28 family peptidase [Rhodanobacter thiooxydans]